jgi:hypothetical protein
MKVLVWREYGDIEVYEMSTVEQALKISEDVISCMDGWGVEEQIQEHKDEIAKILGETVVLENLSIVEIYKSIKRLLSNVGASGHESFENFELKDLK